MNRYTLTDLRAMLHVDLDVLQAEIDRGELHGTEEGSTWTCTQTQLDDYLNRHTVSKSEPDLLSILISPRVQGDAARLTRPPRLIALDRQLLIGTLCEDGTLDASDLQPVYEVVHLHRHELVMIVTDLDLYLITAAEFNQAV